MLFLMVSGTVFVNAQVRIGGNAAPNASALLDLNATDVTNSGTKGLALPRVNLTSDTMQLTTGVANLRGMLVYNTTAFLGVGIYSWIGNIWKQIDAVPDPTSADSGLFLMSTGISARWRTVSPTYIGLIDTIRPLVTPASISWSLIIDTTVIVPVMPGCSQLAYRVPYLKAHDKCSIDAAWLKWCYAYPNYLRVVNFSAATTPDDTCRVQCYRPSI